MTSRSTSHLTIVTRMGDRRIMSRPGTRHNHCGAEPTLGDLTMKDAKRCLKLGELEKWLTCETCQVEVRKAAAQ